LSIFRKSIEKIKVSLESDKTNGYFSGFGGLGVSALAFGTQILGFKPGRSRRIFLGEKILSAPSFGREVKPWVPRRFVEVGVSAKLSGHFSPT
jgi:hypothetical protein